MFSWADLPMIALEGHSKYPAAAAWASREGTEHMVKDARAGSNHLFHSSLFLCGLL